MKTSEQIKGMEVKDILKELKKINIESKYISKIEEALGR